MENTFSLFDTFIDSTAVLDPAGTIIYTNNAWKKFASENSGEPKHTDLGVNYLNVCHTVVGGTEQNAQHVARGIEKVIKREQGVFEHEYDCHSPDEKRWFILRCLPVAAPSDLTVVSHLNVTSRRLSEQKVDHRNEQLKQINSRLHATAHQIVHDLQTPLSSIEGLIKLSKFEKLDAPMLEYVSLMEKSVNNLKTYVKETLKLSSLYGQVEQIDFTALLADIGSKFEAQLTSFTIHQTITEKSAFATNKPEFISMLSNTIHHAINSKSDAKKAELDIHIIANDFEAKISIAHNGKELGEELIRLNFDKKFRSKSLLSGQEPTDLERIRMSVEALHGNVQVLSTKDKGTEFIFEVPNLKDY